MGWTMRYKKEPHANKQRKFFAIEKSQVAKASDVYFVTIFGKTLVIKDLKQRTSGEIEHQKNVLKNIAPDILPRLLGTIRCSENRYIQILTYFQGKHCYGTLSDPQTQAIFTVVKEFKKSAKNSRPHSGKTLHDLIKNCQERVIEDEYLSQIGDYLYTNQYLSASDLVLTHYDLHRGNILIDNNQAFFVDAEAVIYAPPDFQAACLFMSCFYLYLPEEQFDLQQLQRYWQEPLNTSSILTGMLARAWIGASFFYKRIKQQEATQEDSELYEMYLKKISYIQQQILQHT